MVGTFWKCGKFVFKFRGYEPQPITPLRLYQWLRQFDSIDRNAALALLDRVIYFDKRRVITSLVQLNIALHDRLKNDGIPARNVIYIHIDEPGSSSSIMMDLLRSNGPLRRLRCKWIDYSNQTAIIKAISASKQEGAAVVYVDDFLGSGKQFCRSRDFAAEFFPTAVPEFVLAPCLCEEAYFELSKRDIQIFTSHVHTKSERPLHQQSFILNSESKERLRSLAMKLNEKSGLGFNQMAANVAIYRNSPNNMPLVLRGAVEQTAFRGIFPRLTDLPPSSKY